MSSLAKVTTVSVIGIKAVPALVEVHIGRGLPTACVLGLGDTAVRESRDRVKAAFESCGLSWPRGKVTINLAPADLPKAGSYFDLPIAAGIAAAAGLAPAERMQEAVLVGELGLDGSVKRCRDVLPVALHCRSAGRRLICPRGNFWEASLVEGVEVVAVEDLLDFLDYLRGVIPKEGKEDLGRSNPTRCPANRSTLVDPEAVPSASVAGPVEETRRSDVHGEEAMETLVGHEETLRAVAAATVGMLNVLLWGPPGSGKTLIGRGCPALLPDLDLDESLEVRMVHCLVSDRYESSLPVRPPFRAPHHTASPAALVGGGMGLPRPGEVSLAHNGVLFLDELALFSAAALESLRQPLEDGVVRIARANATVEYPARPMVVAATNTCPCGASERAGTSASSSACRCTEQDRARFLRRISGPLVDRFDLALRVRAPEPARLLSYHAAGGSGSEDGSRAEPGCSPAGFLGSRVAHARQLLAERLGVYRYLSRVPSRMLPELLALPRPSRHLLERWALLQRASARRVHKMVRLVWALAALDGASLPEVSHLEEAFGLFVLPKELSQS